MTDQKRITIMTREVILQLPKLRAEGMANYEIAKKLKVSTGTIKYWFKRLEESGHEIGKPVQRGGIKKINLQ